MAGLEPHGWRLATKRHTKHKEMLDLQPASFEAFEREARQGNVVPVVRSVLADLHTPVGTFMRIADKAPYSFLLESVEGGERIARYSFLGAEPEMCVRG